MSADLLAEFGPELGASKNPSLAQSQSQASAARPETQPASSFSSFALIDDGWSTASAAALAQEQQQQQQQTVSYAPRTNAWSDSQTPISATAEENNDDWGDFEGGSSLASPPSQETSSWQRAPVVKAKKSMDSSVLFDAEDDFGSDDEFGEFQGIEESTVTSHASAGPSSAWTDLLGDSSVSQPNPSGPRESKNTHSRLQVKNSLSAPRSPLSLPGTASKPPIPSKAPTAKQHHEEADWDSFDGWEPSIPSTAVPKQSTHSKSATGTLTAQESTPRAPVVLPTADDSGPNELPPTNVPPPGVLLSLFPSFFHDAQEKLFKPMAAQPLAMRNRLLAEAATIAYLAGYLALANVAAHIIAGRKLRWKRDQHLAQGMRIGPASSRATSGMKLAGVDKGESKKEESEVADVVRLWKQQVGRLRHVVSGVNQTKTGTLDAVPDLQEVMPVRTLKQSEGGMPARLPCMLCGLKREERVTAADLGTDDSFGAWWIDQVNMHRGCRNFWNQHKDSLRQR